MRGAIPPMIHIPLWLSCGLNSVSWRRSCPPFTELKVRFRVLKKQKLNEILNELRQGLLHLIFRILLNIVLLAANSVRLLLRSGVILPFVASSFFELPP